ncbi:MAG: hypothetical protein ACJ8AT_27315 [Hyalangium sp.]|uniref:hypothetical protein n=1 Tax=Hyalangium sp. TaxID=2028555 RepID=UPI00389A5FD6
MERPKEHFMSSKRGERFNRAMERFKSGIAKVDTTMAALAFATAGRLRGGLARDWYANFEGYLMHGHAKPDHWTGASLWELQFYAEFDKRRQMKEGKAPQ